MTFYIYIPFMTLGDMTQFGRKDTTNSGNNCKFAGNGSNFFLRRQDIRYIPIVA